jgi:hypothetical protein
MYHLIKAMHWRVSRLIVSIAVAGGVGLALSDSPDNDLSGTSGLTDGEATFVGILFFVVWIAFGWFRGWLAALWVRRQRDEHALDRVMDDLDAAARQREVLDALVELDALIGDAPTLWSATYIEAIAGMARMQGRADLAAVVADYAHHNPRGSKVELALLDEDPEVSLAQISRWRDQGWSLGAFGTDSEPRMALLIGSPSAEAPTTGRFPTVTEAEIDAGYRALAAGNPNMKLVQYWCEACGYGPTSGVEMPGVFSVDRRCLGCGASMVARPAL